MTQAMGVPGGMFEMGLADFLREGRALLDALGINVKNVCPSTKHFVAQAMVGPGDRV